MKKLVRDYIPETLSTDEKKCYRFRQAQGQEYWELLKKKLLEEANEFVQDEDPEEMADLMEVIEAIVQWKGWSIEQIKNLQNIKRSKKGGFSKGIIIEKMHL